MCSLQEPLRLLYVDLHSYTNLLIQSPYIEYIHITRVDLCLVSSLIEQLVEQILVAVHEDLFYFTVFTVSKRLLDAFECVCCIQEPLSSYFIDRSYRFKSLSLYFIDRSCRFKSLYPRSQPPHTLLSNSVLDVRSYRFKSLYSSYFIDLRLVGSFIEQGMGGLRLVGCLKMQLFNAKEPYKRDCIQAPLLYLLYIDLVLVGSLIAQGMRRLRLVGCLKMQVSNAKEPYKRDCILQKKPIFLRSLLIIATPQQSREPVLYLLYRSTYSRLFDTVDPRRYV